MEQDYSGYSIKTQTTLKKADNFLYESRKLVKGVKELVNKVNDTVLLDNAESEANRQQQKTI